MIDHFKKIHSPKKQPRLRQAWSQSLFMFTLISALAISPFFNQAHAIVPFNIAVQMVPASFADLVDKVRPSVVSISTTKKSSSFWQEFRRHPSPKDSPFDDFFRKDSPFEDFFRRFFERESFQFNPDKFERESFQFNQGKPEHKASGLGSGFIINADGLIVTNHHVIEGADEIKATLNDGSKYSAKVLGHDAKTDLALLKIEADKPLPHVSFGDSDKARVGDWVIAVGNPFGFGGTFTVGIISARGRDIQSGPYDDFIQIDASINKGNSGGPLLNMDGEVIGINTAIYSPTGGNVGIGFAVPTSMAVPIIEQLQKHGSVERGWLGVQIQSVNEEIAESLGMQEAKGALVVKVLPGTPAEKAGILAGDVIIEVNGQSANSAKELSRIVANTAVGKPAKLSIWRHGSMKKLEVILGRMSGDETVTLGPDGKEESSDVLGLKLAEITEKTRQQYKLSEEVTGIIIVDIKEDSAADEAGLQRGDVIMMVNQKQVSTPDEVASRIEQATKADRKMVLLLINRQGSPRFMTVKIK
jgi:serine protease Do